MTCKRPCAFPLSMLWKIIMKNYSNLYTVEIEILFGQLFCVLDSFITNCKNESVFIPHVYDKAAKKSLQWCHNGRDSVSNHQSHDCLLNRFIHSDANQRKHQSSASLAFVRGIHRWPVNSPQKWPVTRKRFPGTRWRHHVKNSFLRCILYVW